MAIRHRIFSTKHLFLLVGILLTCCVYSHAGDEFQYRIGVATALDLAKNWKGTLETQSTLDDRGHQIKNYNDVGVAYTGIVDWFALGGNYRNVFRQLRGDTWVRENRLYLNFIARHRLWDVGFNHRIRLEYNSWEQQIDDFGTVRYRFGINPPLELDPIRERKILKDYKVRPYGTYELSYNTFDQYIANHSFKAGLSFSFTERFSSNIYYVREESRSEINDRDMNVLGFDFNLLF